MGKPEDLINAVADLKEEEALKLVKEMLDAGEDPFKIMEYVRKGMEIVGNRFANSEYFISDLIYAGEILKAITALIKPKLIAKEAQAK
ncbi:MAG: B12-binding domain-containing protein, partial [Candidatus Bathyarchaeia archaeon]